MITQKLIQSIKKQYALNWLGIHGVNHWARVYTNGIRLAECTGANINVIKLFAVFHDSRRLNDGADKCHGARGAELAIEFRGKYFELPDDDFNLLLDACRQHTHEHTHDDITVQTCFDADRLDLARVGKIPNPDYLCTDTAKKIDMINWSNERSSSGYVPDIVSVWL